MAVRPPAARPRAGFTLIEVLIALAILALALAAAVRASGIATDGAIETRERLLALWVAQNHIAAYSAGQPFPAIGERSGEEFQYDTTFTWRETVSGTPNPYFRRVEVKVYGPRRPDYALAQLVSHVANPK
jgi:general secretion pathway protein I